MSKKLGRSELETAAAVGLMSVTQGAFGGRQNKVNARREILRRFSNDAQRERQAIGREEQQ